MKFITLATMGLLLAFTFATHAAPPADALQRARAIEARGIEFLKSQQKPDGGFQDQKGPPAITAIALKAIVQSPDHDAKTPFVRKGFDKLLSHQYENGGIYRDLLANYNTAIAVMALASADEPAFDEKLEKAVAYLKSLQWNDTIASGPKGEKQITVNNPWFGGFGYGSKGRPDGSNTQFALEALHEAGVPKDDPAFQSALKFIERMQNRSESNDQPWAGDDGGSVYTPANNGESFAGEYTDANGKRLLRSYGSMTYAMLKSYIYAGLTKDDPRVKAAWDWIQRNWTLEENPGMRFSDASASDFGLFYYYMTLGRALNVFDEPILTDPQGRKHDWRVELINKFEKTQRPDGSFLGEAKWMENNPVLATSYALLAVQEAIKDLEEHPAK